ncbi:hypothetical protein AB0K15_21185 [Amycolatopsis sp. NPDC049253]
MLQQTHGLRSVISFSPNADIAKYWQSLPGVGESEVLIPHMIEAESWTD